MGLAGEYVCDNCLFIKYQPNVKKGNPYMSPSQKKVRIWWDAKVSAYRLQGDFKPELIEFLKANIPQDHRGYEKTKDPVTGKDEHLWTFIEQYFDGMQKAAFLFFGQANVAILTRAQVESATRGPSSLPNMSTNLTSLDVMLVEFMKLIPFEAAQSAYRKAAMVLHPDRQGGSMEKMTRLNSIWTRIEKEIYQQ
jgi:hypothetical protein